MKSHDDAVIEMLRSDPNMAADYLRTAFNELDEEVGEPAFLMALRHVVEAQGGMATIAERAKVSRESLYRALSYWQSHAQDPDHSYQGDRDSLSRSNPRPLTPEVKRYLGARAIAGSFLVADPRHNPIMLPNRGEVQNREV